MASPLCGTGLYANDVLCEIIRNLDDFIKDAKEAKDNAYAALADLKTSTEAEITALAAINYSVNTDAVPKNYSQPAGPQEPNYAGLTPSSPDIPGADNALISDEAIEDIFDDAADRISRLSVKDERDASYQASSMGVGMMSAALQKLVKETTQTANERINEVALQESIKTGEWKREDAKALYTLQVQNFGEEIRSLATYLGAETGRFGERINKYKADIQSEGERRGWSELQIKNLLEQADKVTAYALQKAKVLLDLTRETQEAYTQLTISLTNAIYSAINQNLSGQGSQGISTSIAE